MSLLKRCATIASLLLCCADRAYAAEAEVTPCGPAQLAPLTSQVSDITKALDTLGACLHALDLRVLTHTDPNSNAYCLDNPQADPALRLANFELRLADYEGSLGTFCCSADECKANCPQGENLSSTCGPDCKPHAPALLTTLELEPRIKNVANRLGAYVPLVTYEPRQACDGQQPTDTTTTPTGLDGTVTGL